MYMKYKLNLKIRHTAAWCGLRTTICSAYESHRLNFRGFQESFGMKCFDFFMLIEVLVVLVVFYRLPQVKPVMLWLH